MRDDRFLYVVAYDVPDDRRRARLAASLQNFMPRVQYSLFEGPLTDVLIKRVRHRIDEICDPHEDAVRIYRLCSQCEEMIEAIGGKPPPDRASFVII
ncbi:MAG: CRISPR-associated endonuclease Cas2 [Armatimonadota bacterium]|nr:CRISPR-associated endonuclease Cas2 [Armatimonadota bacterium]